MASLPKARRGDVLVLVRGMILFKRVPIALAERELGFNQDIRCLRLKNGLLGAYAALWLRASEDELRASVTTTGHGTGRLDSRAVLQLPIRVPGPRVQNWVVTRFETISALLRCLHDLVAAKRLQQAELLERVAAPRGAPTVRLGDCVLPLRRRNSDRMRPLGEAALMGVSRSGGLHPMRGYVRGANLARHWVVPPGAFAFNPMRLTLGSMTRSKLDTDCLVSPDYGVFECRESQLHPSFLAQMARTDQWSHRVARAATGGVRARVTLCRLLELRFPIPSPPCQVRAVRLFEALDREVQSLCDLLCAFEFARDAMYGILRRGELRVAYATG